MFPYIFCVKECFRLYREQLLFYCYISRFSKDHQIDTIFGREGCINVYLHTYVCLLRGEMPVCIAIHLFASLLHSVYHRGRLLVEGT